MTIGASNGAVLSKAGAVFGAQSVGVFTSDDYVNLIGDNINSPGRFLDVVVDATNVGVGPGTVTMTIDGKDPASGKYYNLLTSAALNAVATTVLRIGPGLTPIANLTVNQALPGIWRVTATVAVNAVTATIGFGVR
jgi:hypothetical protein